MLNFLRRHIFKLIYLLIIGIIIWLYCVVFSGVSDAGKNNTDDKVSNNTNVNKTENVVVSNNNNIENTITENTVSNNAVNNIVVQEPVKENTELYYTDSGDVYTIVGVLRIESIGLEMEIASKTTDELMLNYACRLWGPYPGQVGNLCIIGHNWLNTKLFSKVPYLEVGDTFEIIDFKGESTNYRIYDKYMVDPDDVSCIDQETGGKKIVTIITCNDDSSLRYVFKAEIM